MVTMATHGRNVGKANISAAEEMDFLSLISIQFAVPLFSSFTFHEQAIQHKISD